MTEKRAKLTRRKFMALSSAAVASPLLLNLPGMAGEAGGSIADTDKIYYITKQCIGCQVCRMFCPADAIHFGDCRNEIDQERCVHCGTCYEECLICAVSETQV